MVLKHESVLTVIGLLAISAGSAHAGPVGWRHWRNSLRPRGTPAQELTLARDGHAEYSVVISANATSQERKAADELVQWLGQMTTGTFPLVTDAAPLGSREISVGATNRLQTARPPIAARDLGDEGYTIAVRGERLFLLGGRKRGIINAVFALLEEDLGCRWYTAEANRIPRRPTLAIRPVPRSYVPPLQIRDPFYHDAFNGTWSLRNRTNAPNAAVPEEWGGHVNYALFVHTYNTLVPPGKYFKEHPEYYMQNADGKRVPRQLCQTNSEAIRIATESCLRVLQKKPNCEIISVSKNDGGGSCVCDRCKALDQAEGSEAASLLYLVNKVAEEIEKRHPEVLVSTLAYLETSRPPKTIRPRQNVAIRLCTDRCMWSHPFTPAEDSAVFREAMLGWSKIHNRIHIWDYCVNFSHYLAPMPNMKVIASNIRFFVAHNGTGVMEQGAYQSSGGERELMRAWVIAKLLWDPSRDVDALMQDFIWGYYGQAAAAIAEYNRLLERTGREHAASLRNPKGGIRYPMDHEFLSKEFLDRASALFDRAEKLAENEVILHRVELARLPIIYVQLCRGPKFVGAQYSALVDRFEAIARREGITHLREGPPDLDQKLKKWRDDLRVYEELQRIEKASVKIRPLSPVWRFRPDPKDVGVSEGWLRGSFDDRHWAEVRSDRGSGWESQGFRDYTGFGWYRQSFPVPAQAGGKRLYLYFGAVDEDAYVYLNGKMAYEHTCKSTKLAPEVIWVTPFAFDATEMLKAGRSNNITVRVYNRLGMGGIYKPVYLVAADRPLDAPLITALLGKGAGRE